uniref:Calmodulin n=1 Tax=Steinernema glaseri TaxID=37863 RepID=A0A1I8AMV4_9BILA
MTTSPLRTPLIKAAFLLATVLVAVMARPKHSHAHQTDNDKFIRDLFLETDVDEDGVVSKTEVHEIIVGLAQEKGLDEEMIEEQLKPHLTFAAFAKLVKDLSSPLFEPVKLEEVDAQRDPTDAELKALELFRHKFQPSDPCDHKKPRKFRPLHPTDLFNTYKNVRDADHVEDLFDEADTDKDMELKISEVVNLMRVYKVNVTNTEMLIFFVRAMDERGVIRRVNDFRIFLESAARSCHQHVTGELLVNKSLRDRCYVQQCLIENEKYRTYPLPDFHSHDTAVVRKAVELYASFVGDGNSSSIRNFDRLLRSKSFRRQLRNPIFTC